MKQVRGIISLFLLLTTFTLCLYSYLRKQNQLATLSLEIPKRNAELRLLKEKNLHLHFSLEQKENPAYLLKLLRESEFSHLKHPTQKDVLSSDMMIALQTPKRKKKQEKRDGTLFVVGAKP